MRVITRHASVAPIEDHQGNAGHANCMSKFPSLLSLNKAKKKIKKTEIPWADIRWPMLHMSTINMKKKKKERTNKIPLSISVHLEYQLFELHHL